MKYGIVASGGGMSCAYSVGVSLALRDLGLTKPSFIVCGSGSAGTFSYWTAGQYKSAQRIWEDLLPSEKFVSLSRLKKIMDIDYLVDEIFKKQEPLLTDQVRKSKIDLLIGTTNYRTGQGYYFSNHDSVDIFEVLRASKALPVAYNRRVMIQGQDYIDGDLALPLSKKIKEAKRLGFDKLVVIDNENHSLVTRLILPMYSLFVGKALRHQLLKQVKPKTIPSLENIIMIKPTEILPISALNNNSEAVKKTVQVGYADAIKNIQLLELSKNVLI